VPYVLLVGLIVLMLLVFQVLTGTRVIHFQGRTHLTVHRLTAFTVLGIALIHVVLVMGYFVFRWF
jgi:hypothetical protein